MQAKASNNIWIDNADNLTFKITVGKPIIVMADVQPLKMQ